MSEEKTLSEQLRDRLDQRPDQFTLRWWREQFQEVQQGYRGATHSVNKAAAEARDCWAELKKQRDTIKDLIKAVEQCMARIGEQHEQITELKERLDKASQVVSEIRQGLK